MVLGLTLFQSAPARRPVILGNSSRAPGTPPDRNKGRRTKFGNFGNSDASLGHSKKSRADWATSLNRDINPIQLPNSLFCGFLYLSF